MTWKWSFLMYWTIRKVDLQEGAVVHLQVPPAEGLRPDGLADLHADTRRPGGEQPTSWRSSARPPSPRSHVGDRVVGQGSAVTGAGREAGRGGHRESHSHVDTPRGPSGRNVSHLWLVICSAPQTQARFARSSREVLFDSARDRVDESFFLSPPPSCCLPCRLSRFDLDLRDQKERTSHPHHGRRRRPTSWRKRRARRSRASTPLVAARYRRAARSMRK
jgi:hypothetical protein